MRKSSLLVSILIGIFTMAQKQNLTPELLWSLGRVSIDAVNDTGDIIYGVQYYNVDENSSTRDLYHLNLDGQIIRLTESKDKEKALSFHSQNEFIYSVGDDIYSYNLKTKKTEKINKENEILSGLLYANNSNHFAISKSVKLEEVLGTDIYPTMEKSDVKVYDHLMYRHWDTWKDGKFKHIFIGSTNGSLVDINKDEKYISEDYSFSPDSKYLVYQSKKLFGTQDAISTNTNIYLYDIFSQQTQNLTVENKGYDTNPKFSPQGGMLTWLSMKTDGYEADKNDLKIYDLATQKTINLTSTWDNTVIDYVWAKNGKKIYFLAGINATKQFFELDIKTKKIRQITNGQHDYVSIRITGDYLVGERQDMNHASEIYKVNIKTGVETKLTSVNDDLYRKIKSCRVEERWINTTDGKKMLVWVIFPPDFDKNKKYPTLLYCQGGPQSTVSQFYSFRWNFQIMASNGYIVVAPNRRGLPSFGVKWNEEISGDWGGQPMKDYLSAIDEVSKESYVDKNRLGAVGASYGGYSVYYLAGIHKKRFKTFISHCGVFDLESMYGSTEEIFFPNYDIGGSYWENPQPKAYKEFNPIKLVSNWDTPILIIHGGRDYRVPYTQGLEAFQAAQLKGIKSRLLYFPEESHWVQQPQNGIIWQKEFFKWLKETL
ncbi:S9 family peptidase [Apibacter sp. wkB309]|uniref:S9 family peptidase n=1 Tax=Apibacter sp. wkB309 TaxID=1679467 RepID=UPI000CFA72BD|nr:S9 family peptidase [Apibacter sp. wkB309]PQL92299.1 S9 family peptidase [Apibacter sp. wkB309]